MDITERGRRWMKVVTEGWKATLNGHTHGHTDTEEGITKTHRHIRLAAAP